MLNLDIDIQVPYTTLPYMVRNTGIVFNTHPDKNYLDQKKVQLEKYGNDLWAETWESKTNQLVQKSCTKLDLPSVSNIIDFALMFEEDVAIMHNGILSAICFCFPSSWIPGHRIGQTLTDVHHPVADGDKLRAASQKIAATMADSKIGSFKRKVWTITTTKSLSNHPSEKNNIQPKSINDLYFRLETQTTLPLGDGITSLFFVKVDVVPLNEIWHKYGVQIKKSVNSMTDAILTYKNLHDIKPILNKVMLM